MTHPLSRIIYGAMRLPADPEGAEPKRIIEKIEACLALGITTFDHADIYGGFTCETLFGAALAERSDLRDKMQIVTKCGICPGKKFGVQHYNLSGAHIVQSCETSLTNLRTNHVDVLLLHRPDPLLDADDAAAALTKLREQGKILHAGVSNFTPSQVELLQSRLDFPLITNQVKISVLHTEALTDGTLDQCQQMHMRPMAWSPLAKGLIATSDDKQAERVRGVLKRIAEKHGVSIDVIALAWLLAHPSMIHPVIGTNRIERIQSAAASLDVTLERMEWYAVYEASVGAPVP